MKRTQWELSGWRLDVLDAKGFPMGWAQVYYYSEQWEWTLVDERGGGDEGGFAKSKAKAFADIAKKVFEVFSDEKHSTTKWAVDEYWFHFGETDAAFDTAAVEVPRRRGGSRVVDRRWYWYLSETKTHGKALTKRGAFRAAERAAEQRISEFMAESCDLYDARCNCGQHTVRGPRRKR